METLRNLGRFLMSGKLFNKEFFFGGFNFNKGSKYAPQDKGTLVFGDCGCALTQCVGLFKDEGWKFNKRGLPVLNNESSSIKSAMIQFNITKEQAEHLFMPGKQKPHLYGGKVLDHSATQQDVARNIFAFYESMN